MSQKNNCHQVRIRRMLEVFARHYQDSCVYGKEVIERTAYELIDTSIPKQDRRIFIDAWEEMKNE